MQFGISDFSAVVCNRLKTFFYIFIKTLVLWKKNVSIAAILFVAVPIRNSALISAETITITGLTAIQIILSGMCTVYWERIEGYLPTFTMRVSWRSIKMPCLPWALISVSLHILLNHLRDRNIIIVLNMVILRRVMTL